jgi:cell division protein FtsI/penicillin-binding protein 2
MALMAAGLDPEKRLPCPQRLTIAGRRFDCTHPPIHSLNAREALAYSCNNYFAGSVARLSPGKLAQTFATYGLVVAPASDPRLPALGEEAIAVTPLELARAYWQLARAKNRVVEEGLALAATAGTARLAGPAWAGKTGTAASPNRVSLQAWFAGWTPRASPEHVMVVFLPVGRGFSDAAPAARRLYESWQRGTLSSPSSGSAVR